MSNNKRIILIAGGSGGHVFPGLSIAQQLIKNGWEILWLGTINHIEADLVPKYDIDIKFIRASGLRGKSIKEVFISLLNIFIGWYQAYRIMKKWHPHVVLCMGGYVSGAGGLAALSCKIPIIVHEQNKVAGLTNKYLSKIATDVLQAFPGALTHAKVVGNPLRPDILAIPLPSERMKGRTGPIRVLVIGGSQGAHILNETLPHVAAKLGSKIKIYHQTGKGLQENVQQLYYKLGQLQHKITDFINNMAEVYSWADVIICRSGALTVSEVTAIGIAAIFVPFQHKDRQQYWNAFPLQQSGAARIIEQPYFTATRIAKILNQWNRCTLLMMADKARQLSILNSTEQIVNVIKRVVVNKKYSKN